MVQTAKRTNRLAPAPSERKQCAPRQLKAAPLRLFWPHREAGNHVVVELSKKGELLGTHAIGKVGNSTMCECGGCYRKGQGFLNDCIHFQAVRAGREYEQAESARICDADEDAYELANTALATQRQGGFKLIVPRFLSAAPHCYSVQIPSLEKRDVYWNVDFDKYGFPDCGCPAFVWSKGDGPPHCKHLPLATAFLKAHGINVGGVA